MHQKLEAAYTLKLSLQEATKEVANHLKIHLHNLIKRGA